jgi:hypothetical protein
LKPRVSETCPGINTSVEFVAWLKPIVGPVHKVAASANGTATSINVKTVPRNARANDKSSVFDFIETI